MSFGRSKRVAVARGLDQFAPMSSGQIRPELLAPAGNWDCARAAVANGADAIYFGLPAFNARMRADNFSESDLPGLMRFPVVSAAMAPTMVVPSLP